MFEFPGWDPKTLTDDQLLERSQELAAKINWASTMGSGSGVEMMLKMSEMIDAERRERAFMQRWATVEHVVRMPIESDPDEREAAKRTQAPEKSSPRKRTHFSGMRRPVPTATPQAPQPHREPAEEPTPEPPTPTGKPTP